MKNLLMLSDPILLPAKVLLLVWLAVAAGVLVMFAWWSLSARVRAQVVRLVTWVLRAALYVLELVGMAVWAVFATLSLLARDFRDGCAKLRGGVAKQ